MTWLEIKKAAEMSGISDEDDLSAIQCELYRGNKTFHIIRLGRFVRLVEDTSKEAAQDASGCAC
jgi:hypothetical protein